MREKKMMPGGALALGGGMAAAALSALVGAQHGDANLAGRMRSTYQPPKLAYVRPTKGPVGGKKKHKGSKAAKRKGGNPAKRR